MQQREAVGKRPGGPTHQSGLGPRLRPRKRKGQGPGLPCGFEDRATEEPGKPVPRPPHKLCAGPPRPPSRASRPGHSRRPVALNCWFHPAVQPGGGIPPRVHTSPVEVRGRLFCGGGPGTLIGRELNRPTGPGGGETASHPGQQAAASSGQPPGGSLGVPPGPSGGPGSPGLGWGAGGPVEGAPTGLQGGPGGVLLPRESGSGAGPSFGRGLNHEPESSRCFSRW